MLISLNVLKSKACVGEWVCFIDSESFKELQNIPSLNYRSLYQLGQDHGNCYVRHFSPLHRFCISD